MVEPVALLALALDAAIGWPKTIYRRVGHPVGMFARVILWCELRWNLPSRTQTSRRVSGVGTVMILVALAGGLGAILQYGLHFLAGPWAWPLIAILAAPGIAQRSLYDHVGPIASALEAGDVPAAGADVAMIVGRDTEALDEAGIARAAIESLAESFCDGVVAPLFWLLALGLPGIWVYKAINTADSMIGHREERWRAFGWATARTDDLLNIVPSRLGGLLICLAGRGGWRIMWRDSAGHASPNAGWPEAAMAGALGLKLAGPIAYDGVCQKKRWIGEGGSSAGPSDIRRALAIYVRACLYLWFLTGILTWAL